MTKLIQSIQRASRIMKTLAEKRSLSLSELSAETELHKTTVLRILNTLMEEKWVYKRMGDGKYGISVDIKAMSQDLTSNEVLTERAGLILDELQVKTGGWPSDVAVMVDGKMEILETTRRKHKLMLNYELVGFQPHILWSALGRAYFAFSPTEKQQQILRRLKRSGDKYDQVSHDKYHVERLVKETMDKGYGTRVEGYFGRFTDFPFQLSAIAVPVLSAKEVIATVNLVWISELATEQQVVTASLQALNQASEQLSKAFSQSQNLVEIIKN